MDRRERLVDAEHDHRQEGTAEDEARDGAARANRARGRRADAVGQEAAERLQHADGDRAGNQEGEERRQEQAEHLGDDAAQTLLDEGGEGRDEQHGDDAATARHERPVREFDGGKPRMGEQGAEDAAEDRRAAELLGGVVADEEVHAPEDSAAADGEQLIDGRLGKRRVDLADDVEGAADEAAGDESGDQRDEDARDALEEQLDGCRVLRANLRVQGLAIADFRLGGCLGRRLDRCSRFSCSGSSD